MYIYLSAKLFLLYILKIDQFNTFLSDLQPLEENDEANNEIVESNNK